MQKQKGTLMLLGAAFIWGIAFVAQSSASDSICPFTFNATRSLIGALFLLIVATILWARKQKKGERAPLIDHRSLKAGAICGTLLFGAVSFQQFGIALYPDGVAASGRAGFLTATYVVMVAVCAPFFGKKLRPIVAVAAIVCLGGMYLLCLSDGISGVYLSDLLLLLCAVCFMFHILAADHYSDADSICVSCVQFAVCAVWSALGMFFFEKPVLADVVAAGPEILYVGILSSGVAYTLQLAGQKYAEPTVASIVMSLESVVAALAGWVILTERLRLVEIIGCVLVFGAVVLSQLPGGGSPHKTKKAE